MSNISGATNALPGVVTDVITQSSGVAIPGGSRVVAMIGQGTTSETLVSQAQGSGLDGLNATFTSSSGSDGRHFALANFPVISNRTTIFKNGISLTGLELGPITATTTFSNSYDYQLDPTTGYLLLQSAHLQDQGGTFYVPLSTNVGSGTIDNLTLVDPNAPPEVWTIRCVSVQRDALNQPICGTAKFLAFGSVSGAKLDANGNPIVWSVGNSAIVPPVPEVVVSNGIISFSINETSALQSKAFRQGDGFTIIVSSGVLVRGDSLTSTEIPQGNINTPTQTQGMGDVVNLCGMPSTTNNLSLGAQLLYANGASSMIAVQAAPPLPRRTSYVLDPSVNALSKNDNDFIFPFPLGVVPDFNSDIHVFVTNPATQVESQFLPNKFPFYTLDTEGQPTTHEFITSTLSSPSGWSFNYTLTNSFETVKTGFDGEITPLLAFDNPATVNSAVFSSASFTFDASYAGKLLSVIDSNNTANVGIFNILGVSDGQLSISTIDKPGEPGDLVPLNLTNGFPDFVSKTSVSFQVIDVATGLPVDGYNDGIVTAFITEPNKGTATISSASVNFGSIDGYIGSDGYYAIQINDTTVVDGVTTLNEPNNGLYNIIGYNAITNTLTIAMGFVQESNLRYEVIDPTAVSTYLVLNNNIVPNGNQLRVTIVDARDASFYDAGWINALASLETVECDILVPLPNQTISVIFQNALSHCITMSNIDNRKERVLFIGAINGLTPANLTGASPAAVENLGILEGIQGSTVTDILAGNVEDLANYSVSAAYGETYRCVYFYPDQIVVQAGSNNVLIDGFYLAAAAAGYANADINLANPFTNKVFSGFTILRNKTFSNLVLEQLASAGVTTLQPVSGGGRVVWGITTSQSGFPEEQEISIVFIRDRVAKVLRSGFSGYIGVPQTPNTASELNTEAVILLNSLITQGLITQFIGLTVVQDPVDPRQWDISVSVAPTYPINWIYIKVSVGNLGT